MNQDRVARLVELWEQADPDRARSVASDRRALILELLHTELGGRDAPVAAVLQVSRGRPEQMRTRARAVRADSARLAAALAAGPTYPQFSSRDLTRDSSLG